MSFAVDWRMSKAFCVGLSFRGLVLVSSLKRFGSYVLCLWAVVTLANFVVVVVDPGRLARLPFPWWWFWYLRRTPGFWLGVLEKRRCWTNKAN